MSTATVTVKLDAESAQIYQATQPEDQAKIGLLLSLLLREFSGSGRTIESTMNEISDTATSLGLTEEKLQAMLNAR